MANNNVINFNELFGRVAGLPQELQDKIGDHYKYDLRWLKTGPVPLLTGTGQRATDPSIPPESGECSFLKLPSELITQILLSELPAKDAVIKPTCAEYINKDPKRVPKRNRASDLMVINKAMKEEVKKMLYEEREFEIHVHQGMHAAGIDFLDVGRQPLHYQEEANDGRFLRFDEHGEFGFRQLKKIRVTIQQPEEHKRNKVTTINTYFMHQSLCRLLRRSAEKDSDRIVLVHIAFAKSTTTAHNASGRQQIMANENYWWHPEARRPRSSFIEGLSDTELVLRPFSQLTGVHNVTIELPTSVRAHDATVQFKDSLIKAMTCTDNQHSLPASHILERHVQGLRSGSESFALLQKYGGHHNNVIENLKPDEMFDEDVLLSPKRNRSPIDQLRSPTDAKRQKRTTLGREPSPGLEMGDMSLDDDSDLEQSATWDSLTGEEQWSRMELAREKSRSMRATGGRTLGSIDSNGTVHPLLTPELDAERRIRHQGSVTRANPAFGSSGPATPTPSTGRISSIWSLLD